MDSLEAITKKIQSFCEVRDWDKFHSPKDLAIGISTEANELLDLFRFKTAEDMDRMMSDEKKRALISDELADVFYFLIRFAQMYDFDLLASLERKWHSMRRGIPLRGLAAVMSNTISLYAMVRVEHDTISRRAG